jgi:uncharacterized membrane protein
MVKWILYIIGILLIIMGLWALLANGAFGVVDPWWHAVLKIVVGAVAIYGGMQVKE